MMHTTCSSVSVVNTLLQWYLQFFSMFQLLRGLSSLLLTIPLTTADTYSHATECTECVELITTIHFNLPSLKQPPPPYAILQHLLISVQRNSLSNTVGELHIQI